MESVIFFLPGVSLERNYDCVVGMKTWIPDQND